MTETSRVQSRADGHVDGKYRRLAVPLVLTLMVLVAVNIRNLVIAPDSQFQSSWAAARFPLDPTTDRVSDPTAPWAGSETMVALVVSSTCGAARDSTLRRLLVGLRTRIRNGLGHEPGERLVYVGVALDQSVESGVNILRRLGPFDEISAGGGWMNQLAIRYLHRDLAGEAATPQILVVRRRLGRSWAAHAVGVDTLLARVVGSSALIGWLKQPDPFESFRFPSTSPISGT